MALLRSRPHHIPLFQRPFSSSSSSSSSPFPPPPSAPASADPRPPSPFAGIRGRLSSTTPSRPRAAPSLDDLRRDLNLFRRSHPTTTTSSSSSPTPSFLDVFAKQPSSASASAPAPPSSSPFPFRSLRDSLSKVPGAKREWTPLSQRQRPPAVLGRDPKDNAAGTKATEFLRQYSYGELGRRLGELRPAGAGKDGKEWFSLEELSARLGRLRQMDKEERERAAGLPGMGAGVLREALQVLQTKDQRKNDGVQSMPMLMAFSGQATPAFLLAKPQEELVERYFHPDHMSSAEKMKLELQRVRDEFKMSENDCGSARVQVAQLTTKIKHLSAILHKKDKHSRKGLQEMVQRRKKYLKYLRRTDWDSYSLVLSKLGLRDVPEFKPPDYKSKRSTKTKAKRKNKRKMTA